MGRRQSKVERQAMQMLTTIAPILLIAFGGIALMYIGPYFGYTTLSAEILWTFTPILFGFFLGLYAATKVYNRMFYIPLGFGFGILFRYLTAALNTYGWFIPEIAVGMSLSAYNDFALVVFTFIGIVAAVLSKK